MLKDSKVDLYLKEGCGRCEYYATPKCKVHTWSNELKALRNILLNCGFNEEYKWSQPCYTVDGKNILILSAFKNYCSLNFFKGSLLKDPKGILVKAGENSQAARQIRFTSVKEVVKQEALLKAYLNEAIELEKAGKKVKFKKNPEPMPNELEDVLKKNAELKKAFEALTPGKQRGYILFFTQPKQSKTRISRIEKCIPKILEGKGMHDK